jgi:hypothetical protein
MWWPLFVLDRDFDDSDWAYDVADSLRCKGSLHTLSVGQLVTSSWSEKEVSWEDAERKSQNAIRTGAAYLTDRQNTERALRREQLKIAAEEARAELIERNKRAAVRLAEEAAERAKVNQEWMARGRFLADRDLSANHNWERETILSSRGFECKKCVVIAIIEPVNARFEVRCPKCGHSILADHEQMMEWIRDRKVK